MFKIRLPFLTSFIIIFLNCENPIDTNTLVKVGSRTITKNDFIEAYSKRLIQSKIKDSNFERDRVLNQLIRVKLFSEAAKLSNIKLDSIGKNRVQIYEEIALRDQLYDEIILPINIDISDSIARLHYEWKNTEIHLSHLFHNDKTVLDTILPYLKNDTSQFKLFSSELFKNKNLKKTGGNLGWIKYDDLDPNLEESAFSIPYDIPSGPFRSSYGWHILLKKNSRKQMILDENHYQHIKNKLNNDILKKKRQIYANNYINNLLEKDVSIDDSITYEILNKINTIVFTKNKIKLNNNHEISKKFKNIILGLKSNEKTILAKFPGGEFTVNDLLNNLRTINPELFLKNPVQQFYKSLRDKILTEKAKSKNLGEHPSVKLKIQSKIDENLARQYLLMNSSNQKDTHFSKEELENLVENLKSKIPITHHTKNQKKLFNTL